MTPITLSSGLLTLITSGNPASAVTEQVILFVRSSFIPGLGVTLVVHKDRQESGDVPYICPKDMLPAASGDTMSLPSLVLPRQRPYFSNNWIPRSTLIEL